MIELGFAFDFCSNKVWIFVVGCILAVLGGVIWNAYKPSYQGESYKMAFLGTAFMIVWLILLFYGDCTLDEVHPAYRSR